MDHETARNIDKVAESGAARLATARVISNHAVCREHQRLVLDIEGLPPARPGQFVHLGPQSPDECPTGRPFLRRAFSIGGLKRSGQMVRIEVLYRVVGAGTRWMSTLAPDQVITALGPLGNGFELREDRPEAWLVAGGVGLPPLLWWAEWLERGGIKSIAFCGARSGDLLALDLVNTALLDRRAVTPVLAAREFAACRTPVIVSTDDGSLGFRGTIMGALEAYHRSQGGGGERATVYCCGPERMMRAVAEWSQRHGLPCQLCMEREMACGTGTCQSCVVPVRDAGAEDGWRYALCCSEGPVFDGEAVIWR